MTADDDRARQLLWHGVLLFFVSLVLGAFVPRYTNPRLGLSAHVGGLMSGLFLAVLGLAWPRLRLERRAAAATVGLALYGNWVSTAGLFLAAVLGTSRSTPLHGAGFAGTPLEEAVVDAALVTSAVAVLAVCLLVLRGLRRG